MTTFNNDIKQIREVEENGEFWDYAIVYNPHEKVIIDKSVLKQRQEYIGMKKNYEEFSDLVGGFTFMLVETLKAFHNDNRFTDTEKARILYLGTYCSYEASGRYLRFGNNKHILKSHLQELLEIRNKQEFYKLYNKMLENEIIEEEVISRTEIRLKWNNKYHFKGKPSGSGIKGTALVKTYDSQVQALYKEKNAKGKSSNTPKNLYVLFMVLPFIHTESGALCRYPLKDITDCEPLEISDLTEMLGVKRSTVLKTKLLNCKLYNDNVFFLGEGIRNRKKYTRIFVSPYVASRSSKKPNETLLNMFPETAKKLYDNRTNK